MSTYQRWRRAGATRYLLRIESSSERIFSAIHPAESSFAERKAALRRLQQADFQTGSGVMIGLPQQSVEDLAADIAFFREMDLDMIGMGPYIPQQDTPMGRDFSDSAEKAAERLGLSLRMIAVTRLIIPDVNIAATTALQALRPTDGRELGLLAGANVIMPNLSPSDVRRNYEIYEGKAAFGTEAAEGLRLLGERLSTINYEISYDIGNYNEEVKI